MVTCKDCFHEKACKEMLEAMGYKVSDDYKGNADRCDAFISKADVVPVVRCSQCKYYTENHLCFHPKQEYGWNSQGGECLQMEANDFCSYGERKNDNE